jgi:hypothetical protein
MLYGYKWTSINGEEFDERSHAGQVWLNKTAHLTDQQWFKGVERCEKEMQSKLKTGDEVWPPSYIQFVEFCNERNTGANRRFTFSLPEPEDVKRERKERGLQHTARILSIFDDE